MLLRILALACALAAAQCRITCEDCKMVMLGVYAHQQARGQLGGTAVVRNLDDAFSGICAQLLPKLDWNECVAEAPGCQWNLLLPDMRKNDINKVCILFGSCAGSLSPASDVVVVDWTDNTTTYKPDLCIHPDMLMLHHTGTRSAIQTLQTLNNRHLSVHYIVEKNGTIYQMVHDCVLAYHVGTGRWKYYFSEEEPTPLNKLAIGIAMVNSGDEPFPTAQMDAVAKLSRMLVDRWRIKRNNIIGHFEAALDRKNDPSDYFDWKTYHTKLGYYEDIWQTSLTADQQKAVVFPTDISSDVILYHLMENLGWLGYWLPRCSGYDCNYDWEVKSAIRAFHRHWCPEIYIKEAINQSTGSAVHDPRNELWYGISQERLQKLYF